MRSAAIVLLTAAAWAQSPKYGVGRAPTDEEVREWAITPSPSGKGLPPGRGTAAQGREMFANRCQKCHGPKGEGAESVALAGGLGTLKSPKPLKTVGSYWPYATTVFDYINRAMPFDKPGTLGADQAYALTAFVLYLNGIVKEDVILDAETLPRIRMPNRDGFVKDPRPDVKKR
jgi:mono/diheme cytochrome c family protein